MTYFFPKKRLTLITCASFILVGSIFYFLHYLFLHLRWIDGEFDHEHIPAITTIDLEKALPPVDEIDEMTAKLFNSPLSFGGAYPDIHEFHVPRPLMQKILEWFFPISKTDYRPNPISIIGYTTVSKKDSSDPISITFYATGGKNPVIYSADGVSFFKGRETDPRTQEYIDGALRVDWSIREAHSYWLQEVLGKDKGKHYLGKSAGAVIDGFHIIDNDYSKLTDDEGTQLQGISVLIRKERRHPVYLLIWFNHTPSLYSPDRSWSLREVRNATVRKIDIEDTLSP